MTVGSFAVLAMAIAVTVALTLLARPRGASTLDFYLAGQRIGVVTNACAICGDYFSAASFLGVAAAVYASGLDGVWYATGFAAGFVPVLLFVAAPLRRFGEFSIPDFLGRRLQSEHVRLCAVIVVELVILSYLVPQAVGSGITWELLVGKGIAGLSPYATGVLVSTAVITGLVAFGGMRGTTWTQAVQFLFLLAVLGWLAAATFSAGFSYPAAVERLGQQPLANPALDQSGWRLEAETNQLHADVPARFSQPGARYGSFGQFALVMTLVMGTAGLPHVMNRYFTSPSGRAARLTTVWVLGLAGLFYALAVLLGTAARAVVPSAIPGNPWLADLTVDGVLQVPEHALLVLGRLHADSAGLGIIATGALVAVMSTIAGLLLAAAASWGHDVYERHINPAATQRQAVRAGRIAVAAAASLSALLALRLQPESLSALFPSIVATMVTWAFALAGSALTPVLLLAIWWRRTTAAGAVAGMLIGAGTAIALFAVGIGTGAGAAGIRGALLTPTLFAAPLAMLVAVGVSRLTTAPADTDRLWLILHGTAADRQAERLAQLTIAGVSGDGRTSSRARRSVIR
ncbi:MAG TPA: cation acetate symporter [Egibacteraceae bacterium]|nr:cation acetate symporter [Egibacteraceae bacterium]